MCNFIIIRPPNFSSTRKCRIQPCKEFVDLSQRHPPPMRWRHCVADVQRTWRHYVVYWSLDDDTSHTGLGTTAGMGLGTLSSTCRSAANRDIDILYCHIIPIRSALPNTSALIKNSNFFIPHQRSWGGYTDFTLSIRSSVDEVVSALYLPQY